MTKDVLVTVKGLQYSLDGEGGDDQRIETITRGNYYLKNGKHYVTYEESPDGSVNIKTMLKFDESFFELTRKGQYSVHMLFEEGKKNYTDYRTPFGNFVVGIDTSLIDIKEKEKEILLHIDYDMDMNYEHLAKCNIDVCIQNVEE